MRWRGWGSGGCSVSGKEQVPELPLSLPGSAGRREGLPAAAGSGERRSWIGIPLEFGRLPKKPWLQTPGAGDRGPESLRRVQLSPRPRTSPAQPRSSRDVRLLSWLLSPALGTATPSNRCLEGGDPGLAAEKEPAARFAGDLLRAACSG